MESSKNLVRSVPFLIFLALPASFFQSPGAFYEPAPFPLPYMTSGFDQARIHLYSKGLDNRCAAMAVECSQSAIPEPGLKTLSNRRYDQMESYTIIDVSAANPPAHGSPLETNGSPTSYRVKNIQILISEGSSKNYGAGTGSQPVAIPAVYL